MSSSQAGSPRILRVRESAPLALVLTLASAGCLGTFTPAQRAQEAAQDLNTAAQFGRMDIASERVAKQMKDDFVRHHAGWGSKVRIVDCDLQGLVLRDQETAEVSLTVGWQRPEESEMRSTTILQRWADHRGSWLLEHEERTAGDVGLLGEPTLVIRSTAQRDVQFQAVRIP